MSEQPIPSEEIIYHRAIQVLRAGFAVSGILLIIGIVWSVAERRAPDERVLAFRDLPAAIRDGDPTSVIDLGIIAMLVTPVILVLLVAWDFYKLNERRFAVASLLVLAVLATSITISLLR